MITPIKDETKTNGCSTTLINLIPQGSIVDSYLFYDGKLEFSLASNKVFVNAHTISKPIYFFWECLRENPKLVQEMVKAISNKFTTESEFLVLQEKWHTNENPYMVAALFFLLNRCSGTGLISSGNLDPSKFNPLAVSRLSKFDYPEHFHLNYKEEDPLETLASHTNSDFSLIVAGKFNYNLFEYGKNIAIEQTPLNHRQLSKLMNERTKKIVATYDYHRALKTVYNNCNLTFINDNGTVTDNEKFAKEVIVANF